MEYNRGYNEMVNFLKIMNKVIGKDSTIILNTGIYKHYETCCDHKSLTLDVNKDIIKLHGTEDNPISCSDLLKAFEKATKQLEEIKKMMEKVKDHVSYYYEGIEFNKKKNKIDIVWNWS